MKSKPTHETYTALQTAYEFFNARLFDGALPDCLITLQRKNKNMYGYFWGARFESTTGKSRTDEIAMNPQHFKSRKIDRVLSTLAHEMVHLWQHHFGKASRSAYHNKEWAQKMKAIGLQPSDTGEPGGKETGQRMTHYILKGELFALACTELVGAGLKLPWGELVDQAGDDEDKNKTNRLKYACPGCATNVWGKPGLSLVCGDCELPFAAD